MRIKKRRAVKNLIWEAIEAGFYNIDIDTSTLVDLSKPTVKDQQKTNFHLAAELTTMIRDLEPEGITISVGGEIGEVGGKNSTVEELQAFMEGYLEELKKRGDAFKGISKISVQTGTTHGGVPLADGTVAKVKIDFDVLEKLSEPRAFSTVFPEPFSTAHPLCPMKRLTVFPPPAPPKFIWRPVFRI